MRADNACEVGEGRHVIQRCRDLGRTAKAVHAHSGDPVRVGRAGLHDARDLFAQGTGAGGGWIGIVQVIQCRRAPGHGLRGGETGLMRGIV